MPYYLISNCPVFLHNNLYLQVFEEVTKDMTPISKISARISGTNESMEVKKYIYEFLYKTRQKDKFEFEKNYVNFDLKEEDAKFNVWDILYDYCHYFGIGTLVDNRNIVDKLISDYEGLAYSFPMGEVFCLRFPIQKRNWWYFKRSKQYLSITINVNKIKRIVGNLQNFYIYTDNFNIICNKNIAVSFESNHVKSE